MALEMSYLRDLLKLHFGSATSHVGYILCEYGTSEGLSISEIAQFLKFESQFPGDKLLSITADEVSNYTPRDIRNILLLLSNHDCVKCLLPGSTLNSSSKTKYVLSSERVIWRTRFPDYLLMCRRAEETRLGLELTNKDELTRNDRAMSSMSGISGKTGRTVRTSSVRTEVQHCATQVLEVIFFRGKVCEDVLINNPFPEEFSEQEIIDGIEVLLERKWIRAVQPFFVPIGNSLDNNTSKSHDYLLRKDGGTSSSSFEEALVKIETIKNKIEDEINKDGNKETVKPRRNSKTNVKDSDSKESDEPPAKRQRKSGTRNQSREANALDDALEVERRKSYNKPSNKSGLRINSIYVNFAI